MACQWRYYLCRQKYCTKSANIDYMSAWSQVIFSRDSFTVFFLPPPLIPVRPRETTSATSQLRFASACFCILLINFLFSNLFSMKTRNAISGKVYEYETVAGNESYSDSSSGCIDVVDVSVVVHSSYSGLIRSTSAFSFAEKTQIKMRQNKIETVCLIFNPSWRNATFST